MLIGLLFFIIKILGIWFFWKKLISLDIIRLDWIDRGEGVICWLIGFFKEILVFKFWCRFLFVKIFIYWLWWLIILIYFRFLKFILIMVFLIEVFKLIRGIWCFLYIKFFIGISRVFKLFFGWNCLKFLEVKFCNDIRVIIKVLFKMSW